MARNSRGFLSGNTKKLRRKRRSTINDVTKVFSVGDKVIISVKAERAGAPHLRYQGRMGVVKERRGSGYVLAVKDGGKTKKIIATALHLKMVATHSSS